MKVMIFKPFTYPEAGKPSATDILREFVADVEAAYKDLDGEVHIDDWQDLYATYQKAKAFLGGLK